MTGQEFLEKMARGEYEPKPCGCGCGEPLEPRFDGERHKIDGKEVNEDCYFDKWGEVVEQHPIGLPPALREEAARRLDKLKL